MAAASEGSTLLPSFNLAKQADARPLVRHVRLQVAGPTKVMQGGRGDDEALKASMWQRGIGYVIGIVATAGLGSILNGLRPGGTNPLALTSSLKVARTSSASCFLTDFVVYTVGHVLAERDADALDQVFDGQGPLVTAEPFDAYRMQHGDGAGAGVDMTASSKGASVIQEEAEGEGAKDDASKVDGCPMSSILQHRAVLGLTVATTTAFAGKDGSGHQVCLSIVN